MLQLRCPGCKRMLGFEDSDRGETVECPSCQHRFVVPQPEHEDLYDLGEEKTYGVDAEAPPLAEDLRPSKLQTPRHGSFEDENDPRGPRRPRRKREETESQNFLSVWWLEIAILMGVGGVWLLLIGLSLLHPVFLLGLLLPGVVMVFAGRIWMLAAAFNEGCGTGCVVWFLPWYGWNLEDRKPLYLFCIGLLYTFTASVILTARYGAK